MPYLTKSLQFDGTQYVTLGDVLNAGLGDVFTLGIWFKTSSATTQILLSKQGTGPAFAGWNVQIVSTGVVRFQLVSDQGASDYLQVSTTTTWADGEWHFALVGYDGSGTASGVTIMVDGTVQSMTHDVNSLMGSIATSADFYFGGRASVGSLTGFVGNLALATIYDRVLSVGEASKLYNGGTPINPTLVSGLSDVLDEVWLLGTGDTHPISLSSKQTTVPWTAGRRTTFYNIPSEVTPADWGRGVSIRDAAPFYPGPGGAAPFSCRMDQASYYRMGPILKKAVTDPFSASIWLRWTRTGSYYGCFMTRTTAYEGSGINMTTRYGSPGDIQLRYTGTGFLVVYTNGLGLNDDNWHHVGISYDGSKLASGVHIVVDGVDRTLTVANNNLSASDITDSFNLAGASDGGGTQSFEGWMSQPIFYGTELSVADFQALYNSGTPVDPTGLGSAAGIEGFWDMGNPDNTENTSGYAGSLLNMDSSNRVDGPGGVLANAMTFNGTDESIDWGNRYNFEYDQPFTIAFWFKTSFSGATNVVFGNTDATFRGYECWLLTTGEIVWTITNTVSTNRCQITTTSTYNDGSWHLCVLTYDGSSSAATGMAIYIDGSVAASSVTTDNLTATILDSGPFRVGQRGSNSQWFSGDLAGFAIYAAELQSADVTSLWSGGTPVDPTGLSSGDYLVGYWQLGDGFYPGVMTGMSSGDIVDDYPVVSTLTTEKTWVTTANYDFAYGGSSIAQGQSLLMDWKNKMVSVNWTVIGSGNSTVYEYAGVTGGGSYGGQSTGPYDVWAATTDIVHNTSNPGAVGWVLLQSPVTASGQFYMVISYYSSQGYRARVYAANVKPPLPGDPLTDYPHISGVSSQWFWILADEDFYRYFGSQPVRTYFSGCEADGSFIFYRQNLNEAYWYHCQQFHVLDADDVMSPDDFPMKAVGMIWTQTATITDQWQTWRFYDPLGSGSANARAIGWARYTDARELELYDEDYLRQSIQSMPTVLGRFPQNAYAATGVSGYPVARVPDIYPHATGTVSQGDQAPPTGTPKYISVGAMWFPGSVVPVFT